MKKLEEMIRTMVLPELSPRSRREVEKVLGDLRGIRRSYQRLRPQLRRQREEAVGLCEELLSHPPDERFRRIRLTRHRLRSRPLVEELLRRSRVAGLEDPGLGKHLAELASQVTLTLFGAEELAGGGRGLNDLQGLVLAHQGHAERRDGRRREAEDCFARALRFLGLGTESRGVLRAVQLLHSQHLRDLGRLAEAEAVLGQVLEELEEFGDDTVKGRALLLQASVSKGRGDDSRVLEILLEACVLVDEDRDPAVALSCWNQLAVAYAEAGHWDAAQELLEESTATLGPCPETSAAAARRQWAWGNIWKARGEWAAAATALTEAWEIFLDRNLRIEGSLTVLDLGAVLAASGAAQRVAAVAEETCRRFSKGPLGRDLTSVLGSFLESTRGGVSPQDLFQQLEAASRRCRHMGDWGG